MPKYLSDNGFRTNCGLHIPVRCICSRLRCSPAWKEWWRAAGTHLGNPGSGGPASGSLDTKITYMKHNYICLNIVIYIHFYSEKKSGNLEESLSIHLERSSLVWMRSSLLWTRSRLLWMVSSLVVRTSCCQCQSRKSPGFDPRILRHNGTWGAADRAALNNVHKKKIPL